MGITTRQSPPPGPPAPFNPGKIAVGYERAEQQRVELEAEHSRLKPKEPPTITGNQFATIGIPPVAGLPAQKPYMHMDYPAWRYHRHKAPDGLIVKDKADEERVCTGPGWSKSPLPQEDGETSASRLELLDALLRLLVPVSEPEEDPEQVLMRLIAERDEFARKAAMTIKEDKGGKSK